MAKFPLWTPVFCLLVTSFLYGQDRPALWQSVDFSLQDFRGKTVSLDDFSESRCVVLAFLGTECPLAKLYAGRLQELSEEYSPDDVAVIGINSNSQDSITEIQSFVQRHGLTFPMLKDAGNRLADQVGAERTPEVFLLDQQRRIRYRGRIDDQYVVGIVRDRPQNEDLKLAINELLDGKPVSIPRTQALGCLIGRVKAPDPNCEVTYSQQISRIFQKHCVQCHREGEIAPFTLTEYDDVVGWGPMIAEVVREKRMPPWHADPQFGKFSNDTSLTEEEQNLIATWVEHGCPEGDPDQLPEPLQFTQGWQLTREPERVYFMAEKPFQVPAQAGPEGIRYQHFWVETGLTEDCWVREAEIRPGNRAVVHHVIVYITPKKGKRGRTLLTAYVPGLRLSPLPPGAAKKLPANSYLHFEVHYTPVGTVQEDISSIGLIFADPDDVTHEVRTTFVGSRDFVIEPEKANQSFTARSGKLPIDVDLISLSPHMHLRGQSFEYEAEYPDGTREILLRVPHYDFNWQTQYRLAVPKRMPAGTVIHATATFDNSSRNLANPDPSATVRWGDQSWDEMFLGYMDIMVPANASTRLGLFKKQREVLREISMSIPPEEIINRLDKTEDGAISHEEFQRSKLPEAYFYIVDQNHDGKITSTELERVLEWASRQ